jgi:multidrug resistance efflux pump
MTKYLLLAAGTTLVIVLTLLIDAPSQLPRRAPPQTTSTELRKIFAAGRVEGATPEIELRPRLAGRCLETLVQEGQLVEAGQVLLRIEDDQHRQQVALAAAELELSEAQLERLINGARREERDEAAALYNAKLAALKRAELEWDRIDQLHKEHAIAPKQADDQTALVQTLTEEVKATKARLDQLQAPPRPDEVRISQARVNAARAKLELAKVELQQTALKAPVRGQILRLNIEPGEVTGPSSTEPPIIMADTSTYRVRAFVEELDAPRVSIAMPATVHADGLPGRQFPGRVTRLSPRMGTKSLWTDHPSERNDIKTREVWIALDRADDLVLGLRVDVFIDTEAHVKAGTTPRLNRRARSVQPSPTRKF